jgi:protein-S-isoprenylcysteine O-methyltransferase Ste14
MFWIVLLAMLVFAAVHSLLATLIFKGWLRERIGERAYEGFYRLAYNIFAALNLLPIAWLAAAYPGSTLWSIDGAGQWVLLVLQLVGFVGFALSLVQIDFGRFAGISQALAYLTGKPLPLPEEGLQVRGVYALVRHPLYLFSLILIWSLPVLTESTLALNIAITLYFVIGSWFEERRMVALFGQAYIDYQQRVPWLLRGVR